jgi:sec-independent protein translocase protein TatA
MFGLGATELLIIFAILVLIFGAKKLPEIGSGIGRAVKNLKKSMKTLEAEKDEIRREIDGSPEKKEEKPGPKMDSDKIRENGEGQR